MIGIDFKLFELVNQFAGTYSSLDQFIVLFTTYGPLMFGVVLLVLWFMNRGNRFKNRELVLFILIVLMMTLGINKMIELSYFRERPFVAHSVNLLINKSVDSPSFPSNHSAGSFAFAFVMLWKWRKVGIIFLVIAVFMALSRLYVGVHYPLDITVGACIALIVTIFAMRTEHIYKKYVHSLIHKVSKEL